MPPIVIFIPTLTMGGAERVSAVLANEWVAQDAVTLVTYFDESHFYPLDPRVRVICLGRRPGRGRVRRSLDVIAAGLAFRRTIRRLRPTFVLSFMNKYNAFALAWLLGTGTAVIVSERGSPEEVLPRLRVLARDRLYPYAAGLIFQTEAQRAAMADRFRVAAVTVIPNPVPPIIAPTQRAPERVILSVGRLIPSKAIDQMIRAFGAMTVPGWRLVICGDGPERARLEDLARQSRAADRIEFAGAVTDLAPFHRAAGLFAFSSLHEGFPNALAEAVVSGIPCVAYDCPTGPADLIEDRVSGRLVPVGDWPGLAAAMDEIAADPGRAAAYGRAAVEIGARLEARAVAGRFLSFCRSAAQSRGVR